MFICVCLYVNSYMRVCACMCVRGNIRVCVFTYACLCSRVSSDSEREQERERLIFTETLRTQGVDKKVNQTSEIKTGNIIPEKGGKTNLQCDYQSDRRTHPRLQHSSIRGYSPGSLGIAPDRCAV